MQRLLKPSAKSAPKDQDRLWPSVVLVFVFLLAAWMGNANGGYFASDWALPTLILAALAVLVSAIGPLDGAKLGWSVPALGLLVAYTAWTLASLLWASNRGDAWLGAGQTFLYLLAFLVTVAFVALGASRRWVLAASVVGPAIVAAFTLQALGSRLGDLFDNDRLVGTVGYYNGEAAFLLVPFWVAVYLGGSRRVNPVLRGLVLASAVLSADLAVLTQSRGAMVALAVSLPVFFLFSGQRLRGIFALAPLAVALFVAFPALNGVYLALSHGGDGAAALDLVLPTVWLTAAGAGLYGLCWGLVDLKWRPPVGVVRFVGGVVLAGCLIALVVGTVGFVERVGNPVEVGQQKWEAFKANDTTGEEQSRYLSASGSGRYTLWKVAWEDFSSHPVLGIGTQNYEATYYQLRERPTGFARQPHMLPLEVLSERGIVGGVLFFGFFATCLAAGLWQRFRDLRPEGKAQVGALVAAVAYWFVHSSAEWFWQLPAVTLPAVVYLALLASPQRAESEPGLIGWPLRAVGVGIAVLAIFVVVPLYVADRHLAQSYAATEPKEALAAVERAQEYNPLDPRLSLREARVARLAGDGVRAEDAYHRTIRLNPDHYAPYAMLAEFYDSRGQAEEALAYYRKALVLNPLDEDLARHISRLGETGGQSAVLASDAP